MKSYTYKIIILIYVLKIVKSIHLTKNLLKNSDLNKLIKLLIGFFYAFKV